MARTLADLLSVDEPAGPVLRGWLATAVVDVQVLAPEPERRDACLSGLQVSAASVLGALAYETGGVLVDFGWLRMLGGGFEELPSLAEANGLPGPVTGEPPAYVVLGWDVLGGVFAIDGGALQGAPGRVCYFAPDALQWEDLGVGHADFVEWALSGGLESIAVDLRWQGWETDVSRLGLGEVFLSDPPLWTLDGPDVDAATRRTRAVTDVLAVHAEAWAARR